MYYLLLSLHSLLRWFVLISLISSIYTAYQGKVRKKVFTSGANAMRHWTATISHMQLLIGMTLYLQSPIVSFPMPGANGILSQQIFFRYVHISLMFLAVVLITVGSAKAKRMGDDLDKYKTMLRWFTVALAVILVAIPWPFSPIAGRPYLRTF
jgi:Ni,Fe-hydrogenase I cytochrome b subunit